VCVEPSVPSQRWHNLFIDLFTPHSCHITHTPVAKKIFQFSASILNEAKIIMDNSIYTTTMGKAFSLLSIYFLMQQMGRGILDDDV
jgi:hypothetical protein